jgi:hypothetical protein
MSKKPDDDAVSDWLRKWLSQLGQSLEIAPGAMLESQADSPLELDGDEYMLSLVVSDALDGVDIARQYPDFFRQMLVDDELRQAFLDSLEILEKSRSGTLEPLPGPPSADLSFLKRAPQPRIALTESGLWSVEWRQTIETLQALLFSSGAGASPVYRSGDIYGEPYFTLLNSEVEIGGAKLAVVLEAEQPIDRPNELVPELSLLALSAEQPATGPLPLLRARLRWGPYANEIRPPVNGQASFAAVPMDSVLNADHTRVGAPLELLLAPFTALDTRG